MIDLDVLLLESQTFRVITVEPLGDHEQFGYTEFNDLTARFPHTDELPPEVEFLEGLDANPLSTIETMDETIAISRYHTMVSEQLDPGLAVVVQILLLDQLQVAAQQFLDGRSLRLERGRAIEHIHHIGADLARIRLIRWPGWLQQRNDSVRQAVAPPVVDEFDLVDGSHHMLVCVYTVDDLIRDDVSRGGVWAVETLREAKYPSISPRRYPLLTVSFEHHLVDQAELVIEVFTDVPMHAEKGIAAHLDTHCLTAHCHGPQHGHHVRTAQTQCQKVWSDYHFILSIHTSVALLMSIR